MVCRKALPAALRGLDTRLALNRHRRIVPFTHRCNLRRTRLHINTAAAAVVAHTIAGTSVIADIVVNHRPFVDRADPAANASHGAVVIEAVSAPVAAKVADTDIAEAVVDATVIAHVASPVAGVEAVVAAGTTLIGGSPKRAIVGRFHPGARNPVVAAGSPRPVARCPHIVRTGSGWLIILGQLRRCLSRLLERLFTGLLVRCGLIAGLLRVRLLWIALFDR